MNKFNNYKLLSILLIIAAVFLFYVPQAQAKGVVDTVVSVLAVVAVVVAVVAIGFGVGAIVAQGLLAAAPAIATTLVGTAIVSAVIVGAGLLAADCLFDGGPIDPNIICTGKSGDGGVSGVSLRVDIKANGSDGPISFAAPASFEIQWAVSGGDQSTTCTATGAWSGNITASGGKAKIEKLSNGNYTYGITCNRSSDGASASDSVIVNVVTDVPIIDFRAPSTVELPDPIHLAWATENIDSLTASGDWSDSKQAGTYPYKTEDISKPRGNYIFTLTGTGPKGSVSETRNVQVIQVPRCSFSANPTTIIPPASSTLSWSCQYADACSIDQGIGSVNNVSGTKGVRPTKTTTYTLTCDGLDGSRSYPATVNVGFTPKLREVIPR